MLSYSGSSLNSAMSSFAHSGLATSSVSACGPMPDLAFLSA